MRKIDFVMKPGLVYKQIGHSQWNSLCAPHTDSISRPTAYFWTIDESARRQRQLAQF